LLLSVWVLISQPSCELWLQSAKPKLHAATMQFPAEHVAEPLGRLLQTRPHWPQLLRLFWVFVSHPLLALRSQSANPALQATTVQSPATHDSVPLFWVQTAAQAPQLLGSEEVFVQVPPHIV
jgi:hypothetical protein